MSALAPLRTTVVDVDLDAIVDNYEALRRRAGGAEVIAVVKADGYGHGIEAVAETLAGAGAAMLAVVTVEEALSIRAAGVRAPVLVFVGTTERPEIEAAIAADCAMVAWDVGHARLIDEVAASAGRRAAIHFKVDTGLTRLGAPLDGAVAAYRAIAALPHVAVDGVMTHFATADDPDPTVARSQIAGFSGFLDEIGTLPRFVHAAASAGVAAFGALDRCTAIRPGVSLYGLYAAPHQTAAVPLRPALTWRSRVRRVVAAERGTGVSYGHEYRLPRDGRVATVPVGYGDGLPRRVGQRGRLLVGGRALPFAGRVCMDLVMLDVTDLPEAREGDEVVVIGAQGTATQTADDVAAALGTVNYEIVTGIRRRVPRRYHRGADVVAQRTLVDGYVRL